MWGNSYNLLPLEKAHCLGLSLLSGTAQGVDNAEKKRKQERGNKSPVTNKREAFTYLYRFSISNGQDASSQDFF